MKNKHTVGNKYICTSVNSNLTVEESILCVCHCYLAGVLAPAEDGHNFTKRVAKYYCPKPPYILYNTIFLLYYILYNLSTGTLLYYTTRRQVDSKNLLGGE